MSNNISVRLICRIPAYRITDPKMFMNQMKQFFAILKKG
jgi:hypothetical protein